MTIKADKIFFRRDLSAFRVGDKTFQFRLMQNR